MMCPARSMSERQSGNRIGSAARLCNYRRARRELRKRLDVIATVVRLTTSQTVNCTDVSSRTAIVHLPAATGA